MFQEGTVKDGSQEKVGLSDGLERLGVGYRLFPVVDGATECLLLAQASAAPVALNAQDGLLIVGVC
jgi:hypothetical protein